MLKEIYSDDSELNMEYNTRDLGKGSIGFRVAGFHMKDHIRCNPVQPSPLE